MREVKKGFRSRIRGVVKKFRDQVGGNIFSTGGIKDFRAEEYFGFRGLFLLGDSAPLYIPWFCNSHWTFNIDLSYNMLIYIAKYYIPG